MVNKSVSSRKKVPSYATLDAKGAVLHVGQRYSIELHDLEGYYSIYGGSVTVSRTSVPDVYPLEGSSFLIPAADIRARKTYPPNGCRADVMHPICQG